MLTGPIAVTERALKRSGLTLDDIGVYEVNEAFACVVLAWQAETGAEPRADEPARWRDRARSPARGDRRAADDHAAAHVAPRRHRYGLQVMCEGGGMANATILERL